MDELQQEINERMAILFLFRHAIFFPSTGLG